MAQLIIRILPLLVSGAIDPLDHEVFQTLFGMIMTLLIAMEFKHSISLAWSTGCCVSAMIASLAARIEPFVLCLLARERPGGAPVT